MEIKVISNQEQGVLKKLIEMLLLPDGEKKIVLGEIEDEVYKKISSYFNPKDEIFISVNRKGTTKFLFESLLKNDFVYVCNNNLNDCRNLNNMVIVRNAEDVKVLFCGFPLTENNLENSCSLAMYFSGNTEEIKNFSIMTELFAGEKNGYVKLTEDVISELTEQRAFRNEKAVTISEELDEDEIVKSFRNMQRILDERQKELRVRDLEEKKTNIVSEIEIEINLD